MPPKNLPRTRKASYEQGWEDGHARAETAMLQDLKPHIKNLVDELMTTWVPSEVTASIRYLKAAIEE